MTTCIDCGSIKIEANQRCASCNRAERKRIQNEAKDPKKRTPIKKVSAKRKEQNAVYSEACRTWLIGKRCACCGDLATEVHHKGGRTNELLLEKKYWLPVCSGCHRLITEDSAWAIQQGYSLIRSVTEMKTI